MAKFGQFQSTTYQGFAMQETFQNWAKETPRIRENILNMIHQAGNGHPGGSLSLVEILYTLFAKEGVMKHSPSKIGSNDRDRLVLCKGHGVPALYAVLSAVGYDITEEELMTLRHLGSRMQGHPDRVRLPIVEASTGSLGQGASIAQGLALGYKLDQNPHRVFGVIGDGEMQEGQVWEVALSAPHHKLDNLTLILDYNKGQIDGPTNEVLNLEPVAEKWKAFGWEVFEIDGHNYQELHKSLTAPQTNKPRFIVAHTIKGKGVDFMEGNIGWHGKATNEEELPKALEQVRNNDTIGL